VSQRISEAVLDAVPHHNPGSGRGSCKKPGRRGRLTHQFILGARLGSR
jgi:hypothetical protein